MTKVFEAWHTPQLQPKQHVQRCKWRNLGADQLEALAIAGLGSGPAAADWRRTPDWLRRWLSVYASGTFAAVGRSWCNVDVGLWGGRWRQQQMKRVGSRPRLYLRSTEMDLKMIFRPTPRPGTSLPPLKIGFNIKYRPKMYRNCFMVLENQETHITLKKLHTLTLFVVLWRTIQFDPH